MPTETKKRAATSFLLSIHVHKTLAFVRRRRRRRRFSRIDVSGKLLTFSLIARIFITSLAVFYHRPLVGSRREFFPLVFRLGCTYTHSFRERETEIGRDWLEYFTAKGIRMPVVVNWVGDSSRNSIVSRYSLTSGKSERYCPRGFAD